VLCKHLWPWLVTSDNTIVHRVTAHTAGLRYGLHGSANSWCFVLVWTLSVFPKNECRQRGASVDAGNAQWVALFKRNTEHFSRQKFLCGRRSGVIRNCSFKSQRLHILISEQSTRTLKAHIADVSRIIENLNGIHRHRYQRFYI